MKKPNGKAKKARVKVGDLVHFHGLGLCRVLKVYKDRHPESGDIDLLTAVGTVWGPCNSNFIETDPKPLNPVQAYIAARGRYGILCMN